MMDALNELHFFDANQNHRNNYMSFCMNQYHKKDH